MRARVGIATALVALSLAPALRAGARPTATCGHWTIVKSDNKGNAGNPNQLLAVDALSTSDAWAVGYAYRYGLNKMMAEHWDGEVWTADVLPSVANENNLLDGVVMVTAKNVWAVGYATANGSSATPVIEHYNGTKWSMVTTHAPSGNDYLKAIAAVSAKDIWAAGYSDQGGGSINALFLHWNGTAWQNSAPPHAGQEDEILALARVPGSSQLWAAGQSYSSSTSWRSLTMRFVNGAWTVVPSANPGTYPAFSALAPISNSNVWAYGGRYSGSTNQTLAEHWDGSKWSVKSSPNPSSGSYTFRGAGEFSSSKIWIVGNRRTSGGAAKTLTTTWTPTHGFTVVSSPNPKGMDAEFSAVTRVPGTKHVWAVGDQYSDSTVYRTLTESYC